MRCVAKRAALPLSASTSVPFRSTRWPPLLLPSRKSPRRNSQKTSSRPSSSASSGWKKKKRRSRTISATSMRRPRATATTSRRCAPSCGCASRTPTSAPSRKPSWKPTCRPWECYELAGGHFRRAQTWAKASHLLDFSARLFGEGTEEMDVPGPERRLAAVLAADMVGYSRLMEVDETGTLARLKTHRIELIDPAIAKNRGRIIKTTGDGMLVEFHSVADAVLCAAEVQRRMARRNADVSPARWIQFRIGINLGDVIVEENDIFGDGVNVAARLEMLAEPGGICVSGAVRDQVGNRLDDVAFEDLGDQSVKNIARPIRVFRVRLQTDSKNAPRGAKEAADGQTDCKEAVPRRVAALQHERRSGAGVLRGRPHRGHHYRAVTLPRPARHLAQLDLRAQGQGGEGARGRARIRRRLRPRGERSHPRHRAADRRRDRPAHLGRTLRPQA